MSDIMTPIPFGKLMNWILEEHKKGSIFGIKKPFAADSKKMSTIFGRGLETPFWTCSRAPYAAYTEYCGILCGRQPLL